MTKENNENEKKPSWSAILSFILVLDVICYLVFLQGRKSDEIADLVFAIEDQEFGHLNTFLVEFPNLIEIYGEDRDDEIDYHEIVPFFTKILTDHPIIFPKNSIFNKLLDKKNIQPWQILNSNPFYTLIPWIHIPKTAGLSTKNKFNEILNYKTSNSPYKNSLFPNHFAKSSNHPGCFTNRIMSGGHCRFSEVDQCLKKDAANLFPYPEFFWEEYYSKPLSVRKMVNLDEDKNLRSVILHKESHKIEEYDNQTAQYFNQFYRPIHSYDYQNIKYLSTIRHPIVRGISEYYYRKPTKTNNMNCAHGSWTKFMCSEIKNSSFSILDWTIDPNGENTSHNRMTRSFFDETFYNKNASFGIATHKMGANAVGPMDLNYLKKHFGQNVNNANDLNEKYEVVYHAIKNVEKNFMFVSILEDIENSFTIFEILVQAFSVENAFRKLELEKIGRQLEEKLKIDNPGEQLEHKSHSTSARGRPEKFKISLLIKLFEKNKLDIILWEYLKRKFDVTVEFYRKQTDF